MRRYQLLTVGVGLALIAGLALLRPNTAPVAAVTELGTWVRLEDLPVKTQEVGVAAASGTVYVVGGTARVGASSALTNNVWAYDPLADEWTGAAPLPGPARDHIAVAAVGGKVYAFGGLTGWPGPSIPDVYEYDPAANGWTKKADIPDPRPRSGEPNRGRGAAGVAVIGGEIYLAGGLNGASGGDAVALRSFAKYNPATNAWTVLPDMPTARDHLAMVAAGGRLYAIGGRDVQIDAATDANEEYDPATNSWRPRANLPSPRGGLGAGLLGGRVVIFGGEGPPAAGWIWASAEEYDPAADSWRTLTPMGVARHGTAGAELNGAIYVPGGGEKAGGGGESSVNERFAFAQTPVPPTPTSPPEPALEPVWYLPGVMR